MISLRLADSTRVLLADRQREYANQLPGTPGEQWLQSRGITKQAMDFFGLGYVETPMRGDNLHVGRLVIPYFTRSGTVALRSTSLPTPEGGRPEPKYLPWMAGDISRPFNTTALDGAVQNVYICEGEMDTITAWMAGFYAVGIPGVQNWKDVFRPMFRYRSVTVLADNDDQGQGKDFAHTIAKKLGNTQILLMPSGHDVNSYFNEVGLDVFKKYVLGESDSI